MAVLQRPASSSPEMVNRRAAGRVAGHVLAVSVRGLQVEHRHREPLAEQRYRQAAHVSGPAHVQHTHDGFFPTRRMPGCSARTSGAVIPSSAVRP